MPLLYDNVLTVTTGSLLCFRLSFDCGKCHELSIELKTLVMAATAPSDGILAHSVDKFHCVTIKGAFPADPEEFRRSLQVRYVVAKSNRTQFSLPMNAGFSPRLEVKGP